MESRTPGVLDRPVKPDDDSGICGKRVGLILTGGNIDFDLFNTWIIPEAAALAGGKALV